MKKNIFNDVKTIFFDYDGTIHDSMKIYAPAFKSAYDYLVDKKLVQYKKFNDSEISFWIGFNGREMWNKFMPQLDDETKNICYSMIGQQMLSLIKQGKAQLYNGAEDTLSYLKEKGYTLVFLSNCRIQYKDEHARFFNLYKYFDDLVCSEQYDFIPKSEILRKIKHKYSCDMIMVGDRFQDVETGKKNNIFTIACNYGYAQKGELEQADILIDSILDLKKYL